LKTEGEKERQGSGSRQERGGRRQDGDKLDRMKGIEGGWRQERKRIREEAGEENLSRMEAGEDK
jgi:hypothetical protein